MVLEKILESPLYSKEVKPFNLKGNQPVTPADSAEASTEGLQVERMDSSTTEETNHGSSKQILCSSIPGGSSERLKALCTLDSLIHALHSPNSIGGQGRDILRPVGGGWLRDPQGPTPTR